MTTLRRWRTGGAEGRHFLLDAADKESLATRRGDAGNGIGALGQLGRLSRHRTDEAGSGEDKKLDVHGDLRGAIYF